MERPIERRQSGGITAHPIAGQLARFLVAGGISTIVYSAVYLPLAMFVFGRAHAVLAVPFAFAVAVTVGYVLHSKWSFRGHGGREPGGARQAKFVGVQGVGLGLHAIITWIATDLLGQPAWVPLVPGLLLVPVVTFFLNRQWVFR
ncbi:GtrA family protein [Sphingomonas japonica]